MKIFTKQYAEALYNVAITNNQLEKLKYELEAVLNNFSDIEKMLKNPNLDIFQKQNFLKEQNISIPIINLLLILTRNNDLAKLPLIFLALKEKINKIFNQIEVKIILAKDINDQQLQKINKILEEIFGKKIIAKKFINQKIIGGVIMKIGNNLYDASIESKLKIMQKNLLI